MRTEVNNPGNAYRHTAPVVSVIIPVYNSAEFIGETLASVFAQTFTEYEVIVINDGSPDTAELEVELRPFRDRIIYLEQENRGPAAARNLGIRRARGKYVALLDSDDVWMPEFLAEQLKILRGDSALDLVYADALLFGDSPLAGQTFMATSPSHGPVNFESLVNWQCVVLLSTVVARRQALIEAGLFDEDFWRCEDFDLWLRMAHRGLRIAYQTQLLGGHRCRRDSLSATSTRMLESEIEVLRKIERTLPLTSDRRRMLIAAKNRCQAAIDLERGKQHLLAGDYRHAREILSRSGTLRSTLKLRLALLGLRFAPGLLRRAYRLRYSL
ncbi:MAG TPA: glycosyltransferase family A protein [Blastocatellia bacterium]|nr:glycosyltransferase family A protein [Blastocatellia bacterium]